MGHSKHRRMNRVPDRFEADKAKILHLYHVNELSFKDLGALYNVSSTTMCTIFQLWGEKARSYRQRTRRWKAKHSKLMRDRQLLHGHIGTTTKALKSRFKMNSRKREIIRMLNDLEMPLVAVAKHENVHPDTLRRFLKILGYKKQYVHAEPTRLADGQHPHATGTSQRAG